MPYDGFMTRAVVKEISSSLIGGRVNKIYQPQYDVITMSIRNKGENKTLYINCNGNDSRLHFITEKIENPVEPMMFCMVLRKHLNNAIIENIEQFKNDRIIIIQFISANELGYKVKRQLYVELMGKYSNIVLLDEDNVIIDALKKVTHERNKVREIMPGVVYDANDIVTQANPFEFKPFTPLLGKDMVGQQKATWRFLISQYMGFSPVISKALCLNANVDASTPFQDLSSVQLKKLEESIEEFLSTIEKNEFTYVVYRSRGLLKDYYMAELIQLQGEEALYFNNCSEMLEFFYQEKKGSDRFIQREENIAKKIRKIIQRNEEKLLKLKEELSIAEDRSKYKVYGDLINSNLHTMQDYSEQVELANFYDENMNTITIPLDIQLSATENASRYYKLYSKLKNASIKLKQQINITKREIEYLKSIDYAIAIAKDNVDIDEIMKELKTSGYIKSYKSSRKSPKKQDIVSFTSPSGLKVLVGKNNLQNESITFKHAHKEDWWFHIKDYPGAHVVLITSGLEPTNDDLIFAATLAVENSSLAKLGSAPVDYTKRKYVRRIPGGKPGMVNYTNHQTIYINKG